MSLLLLRDQSSFLVLSQVNIMHCNSSSNSMMHSCVSHEIFHFNCEVRSAGHISTGYLSFGPMAQCVVHALSKAGLATRVSLRLARMPRLLWQGAHVAFAPRTQLRQSFSRTPRLRQHQSFSRTLKSRNDSFQWVKKTKGTPR
jgi:hypothetical protein